ncbi:uncharacterized protein NEPG_01670 [Nematocida parisii ERTm1]|uniref:uncharacterized protein n=1 Tax=Nematocida parisii (strain ERTm1 / ATCC PRA-289) TaxID=881290 RepID=UPI000264B5A6|nr:uncharacterized protein NEPG_01670 [Nematocida parisii ERTm1]EIJ93328.1 hypothetical protein NEPG_01670 [Nematocida parisii ERTm1]|eukprot:XP_013059498.1 hypothetical protein NEPG_01670 [Nematocida parisii ERTm1]
MNNSTEAPYSTEIIDARNHKWLRFYGITIQEYQKNVKNGWKSRLFIQQGITPIFTKIEHYLKENKIAQGEIFSFETVHPVFRTYFKKLYNNIPYRQRAKFNKPEFYNFKAHPNFHFFITSINAVMKPIMGYILCILLLIFLKELILGGFSMSMKYIYSE